MVVSQPQADWGRNTRYVRRSTIPLPPIEGSPYAADLMVCTNCGFENAPGAKFCSECGTALAEAQPSAGTERKVVTVLFADLVGFTSRAERLDPQDVQAVLKPYHERLR